MPAMGFDVIVIGGGHAGAEAARAACACGARTALVTSSRASIGVMSCNPAIGGVGKGQIVREIDALGGLMGLSADATGMQFRVLNRSKGPAVWGPRCQSDSDAYAMHVRASLEQLPGLEIIEGQALNVQALGGAVAGVRVGQAGGEETLKCGAAVVAAGTFLNGTLHQGPRTWAGGRYGEDAVRALSESLRGCGLQLGRLKTGTCARIAAESIDYARCTRQTGDEPPSPFSFMTRCLRVEQVPCWLTATTPRVHEIIRGALDRAPMFTGQITSPGPRYCPSIETKIVRFADKDSHQVFLEPQGRGTNWVYCNGISTSLPPDVQQAMIAAIPGLERAQVLRWGYAIEYDFAPPTQLELTLQTKAVRGLFLAGQINGTTGYEEAAAQGLLAGLNAARAAAEMEGLVLRRDQAYIGVMIDDLVTKGVSEPYRMLTSRAEHRLTLRGDNADRRLTAWGRAAGLVDGARWQAFEGKLASCERLRTALTSMRLGGRSLWELLQRPGAQLESLLEQLPADQRPCIHAIAAADEQATQTVVTDARYSGYLQKEDAAIRRMRELDSRPIPSWVQYDAVPHLRHEAREKLGHIRPATLGQASRVSGITPADVTVLAIHLAGGGGGR
jgi:tRNA uridine 5-carboxymethylaminomethyl modification enzyme